MVRKSSLSFVSQDEEVIPYHADMKWEDAATNVKLEFFWTPIPNNNMTNVRKQKKKHQLSIL